MEERGHRRGQEGREYHSVTDGLQHTTRIFLFGSHIYHVSATSECVRLWFCNAWTTAALFARDPRPCLWYVVTWVGKAFATSWGPWSPGDRLPFSAPRHAWVAFLLECVGCLARRVARFAREVRTRLCYARHRSLGWHGAQAWVGREGCGCILIDRACAEVLR